MPDRRVCLIVDDDPDYGAMLLGQVTSLGHKGLWAKNLAEGFSKAENSQPDIVFLDIGLPDGDGAAASARFLDLPSNPEVIMVTGAADSQSAELTIRFGCWDYISKGTAVQKVTLSLRRALEYREQKRMAMPQSLNLDGIMGRSPAMKQVYDRVAQVSGSEANLLITGESGTGKELFARAVHQNSRRRSGPFVVVDCAALPDNLVESVLFGHRKGAFTGASESQVGLIEQAHEGTLFLDEVAEMPSSTQKAFLRALQERRFRPVGSDREIHSDFRLVAATNKDLDTMVTGGAFREDLLFRLRSLTLTLPRLAERGEDLRELTVATVASICRREKTDTKAISLEVFDALAAYSWPGNVRELINAVEHAVAAAAGCHTIYNIHLPTHIRIQAVRSLVGSPDAHLPESAGPAPGTCGSLTGPLRTLQDYRREATRAYLKDLLQSTGHDLERACEKAGLSRSRLYALMKEHDVSRAS